MRFTGKCTKCGSMNVAAIEGNRFNTNHYVYLNNWGTKYALIDRFICADCGFLEEYAQVNDKFHKTMDELLKKQAENPGDDLV